MEEGEAGTIARIGFLALEAKGQIGTLKLDRGGKLNAMTAEFWTSLRDAINWFESETSVSVVVVTSGDPKAFSAGGDIGDFLKLKTRDEMEAYQRDAMAAFSRVERCELIMIAAVNGIAFGGGCELALACDFVIAADDATFAMPEAALGLVPGFGAIRAPELIGRQMTKLMIATADPIDAARAYEIGLVQRRVPADHLLDEAFALANQIAMRSPNALRACKRMVNRSIDVGALDYSVEEITRLQASEDRAIGVAAFLARETPVFTGR
jgi:enoyl-CoA hydratase